MSAQVRVVPRGVELFNSWSHGIGALLALVGLVALVIRALQAGGGSRLAAFAVYGASLLAVYISSTLYHACHGRAKAVFRRLDHVAIYLLIAGSYTPFALRMDGRMPLVLLGALWALAAVGTALEFLPDPQVIRVTLCLIMGWLTLLVSRPMAAALGGDGVAWILAGGLMYTVGALFYLLDRRYPPAHGVFHVLVLGGSASHYVAVWNLVA